MYFINYVNIFGLMFPKELSTSFLLYVLSKCYQELIQQSKYTIFLSKGHLESPLFSLNLLKHPYSICQCRQDYS